MMVLAVVRNTVRTSPSTNWFCKPGDTKQNRTEIILHIVQELCESRGGRPGLSVLTSLLVSVDVKNY